MSDKRVTQFLLNILPTIYRMLQCSRQGYDKGVFWRTLPFYNFMKYLCSLITSILSYNYTITTNPSDLNWWIIVGSISTIYSFYWDIAQDWGLLVVGKTWKDTHLIGRKICYGSRRFYIIAIVQNLLLRVVWALSISLGLTDIIDNALNIPGMFKFIVYFLELYRRCLWNFFRVELEHLNNCSHYKAVRDLELPLTLNHIPCLQYQQNLRSDQKKLLPVIQTEQVGGIRNNQNLNSDLSKLCTDNFQINLMNQGKTNCETTQRVSSQLNCDISPRNFLQTNGENEFTYQNKIFQQNKDNLQQTKTNKDVIPDESWDQIINEANPQNYSSDQRDKDVPFISSVQQQTIKNEEGSYEIYYRRQQERIEFAFQQFLHQLKKGINSVEYKNVVKILDEIKPILMKEKSSKVQISREFVTFFDDQELLRLSF